jgi:hypothetical protein
MKTGHILFGTIFEIETKALLLYIRKIRYDWETKAKHLQNTFLF